MAETVTTVSQPWSGIQPFLSRLYNRADALYGSPAGQMDYYPNSTVANLSNQTQGALGAITNLGMGGTPYGQAGDSLLTNTLQGNYLNGNPYLDQMYDRAAQAVTRNFSEATLPGIGTQFSMAGRLGSGAHQNAADWAMSNLGNSLSGLATNIYGGNYAQERQNQMGALGMVPGMTQNAFAGLNQALGAGQLYDAQNQAQLTDQVNRWNFNQQEPWNRLQRYQAAVTGGNPGGGTTTQTGPGQNMTPTYIGAGLTATGMAGSALGWWP